MGKQVHIVVCWDATSRTFWIDDDTTDAKFTEGEVWDSDTEQWECDQDLVDTVANNLYAVLKEGSK
jgi:hypothetical protein